MLSNFISSIYTQGLQQSNNQPLSQSELTKKQDLFLDKDIGIDTFTKEDGSEATSELPFEIESTIIEELFDSVVDKVLAMLGVDVKNDT